MLWLIVFIIILILSAILAVTPKEDQLRPFAFVGLIMALAWTIVMSFTTVPAKDDGVIVSFGKVSDRTLSGGIHMKAPWAKVVDIDGTIQPDRYFGSWNGKDCGNGIVVQIGDGSTTCMSVTNRWRVNPNRTNEIYKNYRSDDPTDHLRDAVVSTELLAAAQDVAGTYNPVNSLQVVDPSKTGANISFKPDLKKMSEELTENMRERVKGVVIIDSITISFLPTPKATQDRISAFIREVANTRVEAQEALSKEQEALGNNKLAASLKNDPNLLISKCLDMVAEGKSNLPANFQCFPGSGAAPVYSVK